MVNGMTFITNYAKDPAFTFSTGEGKKYVSEGLQDFPKLLVSIGSGVSMIKVSDFS